jgi:hypothetical protein
MLVVDRYWSRDGGRVNLTTKEIAVGVLVGLPLCEGIRIEISRKWDNTAASDCEPEAPTTRVSDCQGSGGADGGRAQARTPWAPRCNDDPHCVPPRTSAIGGMHVAVGHGRFGARPRACATTPEASSSPRLRADTEPVRDRDGRQQLMALPHVRRRHPPCHPRFAAGCFPFAFVSKS